jgi:hypothetical protein
MRRRVDLMWTDVSEELIAYIFRIENPRARNQREQVDDERIILYIILWGCQELGYTGCRRKKCQYSERSWYQSFWTKKVYMCMCPIPHCFRDTAISLYSTLYTAQMSNTPCPHTSSKVHWCWRWNFRKCIILGKLYQLCHLDKSRYYRFVFNNFGIVQWNSCISETVRNRTHVHIHFSA